MNNNLIALQAYIDNMNAEFDARCKAKGATFWANFALTAEDMERDFGVGTVEQFKEWMKQNDDAEAEKEERKASYFVSDVLIDAKEVDDDVLIEVSEDNFNYVGSPSHY